MQYLLVENKQIVHLGPVFWRHRFIQSELDDHEIDFQVPPVEPNAYVKVSDTLEIFPIESIAQPTYDQTYEQLVGPIWSFENNIAVGSYEVIAKDINTIKSNLKALAAAERYKKEVAGTKATIQGVEVFIDTSRDGRNIFVQKYAMMGDTDVVQWKFPTCWLSMTKTDLGQVVAAGAAYVESQFVWESGIVARIEAATTVDELKAIVIIEPSVPGVV